MSNLTAIGATTAAASTPAMIMKNLTTSQIRAIAELLDSPETKQQVRQEGTADRRVAECFSTVLKNPIENYSSGTSGQHGEEIEVEVEPTLELFPHNFTAAEWRSWVISQMKNSRPGVPEEAATSITTDAELLLTDELELLAQRVGKIQNYADFNAVNDYKKDDELLGTEKVRRERETEFLQELQQRFALFLSAGAASDVEKNEDRAAGSRAAGNYARPRPTRTAVEAQRQLYVEFLIKCFEEECRKLFNGMKDAAAVSVTRLKEDSQEEQELHAENYTRSGNCFFGLRIRNLSLPRLFPVSVEVDNDKTPELESDKQKRKQNIITLLELLLTHCGVVCFENQNDFTPEEHVKACELFGGRKAHSTHSVHSLSPSRHIFRLSNDQKLGITNVGPQWHNDGSFERKIFSHVGWFMVQAPERNGETWFADTHEAYKKLTEEEKEYWERLFSVNATSGVVHPMVYRHPQKMKSSFVPHAAARKKVADEEDTAEITDYVNKHVYLHLGMTGGIVESTPVEVDDVVLVHDHSDKAGQQEILSPTSYTHRLLTKPEMEKIFHRYNELLNSICYKHFYRTNDFVLINNLTVAHRADATANADLVEKIGLRILHRVTVRGTEDIDPSVCGVEGDLSCKVAVKTDLPHTLDIYKANPFNEDGVWVSGGLGFRWDENIKMQN
ncbi:unnamed protein product [Amoebophrya sp. A120]|nr:unnamed protein product [Amoebophrya sp. A120]|eukprot:GSA120T00024111001.1